MLEGPGEGGKCPREGPAGRFSPCAACEYSCGVLVCEPDECLGYECVGCDGSTGEPCTRVGEKEGMPPGCEYSEKVGVWLYPTGIL